MAKKILILIILIFLNSSVAGTIDPSVADSRYLEYGQKFIHTYKICGTSKDKSLFCASATAINDHWFLTAAHIVNDVQTCIIHQDDKAYEVKKIIVHKDFDEDKFGIADIALCYIEEKLDLEFYPPLYELKDEVGKICSISGYGLTGNFNTGLKNSDMKKRAGSNTIDGIENNLLICSPSKPKDKNITDLEFLIGSGDSGGALYIDGKLAGINSCVLAADRKPDSTYGDESGHTRISSFIGWIKENIK